ncbi:MAG: hypothetical protein HY585_00335, partial [Candidatus Omnitrophica bacterium]|nr:hypothetical protein [Candidatus Omnitrophota bacterium]
TYIIDLKETDIEVTPADLITKTNQEIQQAKNVLQALRTEALRIQAELNRIRRAFRSDVAQLTQNLKRVMTKLGSILNSDGLSEEIGTDIKIFLENSESYLNEELKDEVRVYIQMLTIQMISPVKAKIQSWSKYIASLKDYRTMVRAAGTLGELNYLAEHFPTREEIVPMYPEIAPVDSRAVLKGLIQNGKDLFKQAEAELELLQFIGHNRLPAGTTHYIGIVPKYYLEQIANTLKEKNLKVKDLPGDILRRLYYARTLIDWKLILDRIKQL